jgi:hypothetical protein
MPKRHRKMKGGFLDNISSTLSNWGSTISSSASDAWEKTKNATSSLTGSTPSTSYQSPMTTSTYGGRRNTRKRRMRGGFKDNTPTTGLAAHAAPFSGPTAKPHTWVGGKTRRHRIGGKSRRHRRH